MNIQSEITDNIQSDCVSDAESNSKKRVLVTFKDDSSLLAVSKLTRILGDREFRFYYCRTYNKRHGGEELSERQIHQIFGDNKPDFELESEEVADENFLNQFDAIVSCKFPLIFEVKWLLNFWKFGATRPCFVAMFPGIEFTPKLGLKTRQFADILCLNCPQDFIEYRKYIPGYLRQEQRALQFSPFFFQEKKMEPNVNSIKKVVFFSQSIIPLTKSSRLDVLQIIEESARKHPNVKFYMKLRHLEEENKVHTHKEKHSYQALVREYFGSTFPKNIEFTSDHISDVLVDADLSITCASTAGIESLGAGVNTLFYNSYKGAETEPHYDKMNQFAKDSDLLATRDEILNLNCRKPNEKWLQKVMSSRTMVRILKQEIQNFDRSQSIKRKPIIRLMVPRLFSALIYKFL